jgi:hypothetical protein
MDHESRHTKQSTDEDNLVETTKTDPAQQESPEPLIIPARVGSWVGQAHPCPRGLRVAGGFLDEMHAAGEAEFRVDVGEVGLHGAR